MTSDLESKREWTFVSVFVLSRLFIHAVRPFVYDPRLPCGWGFPFQYAHPIYLVARWLTHLVPLTWVMRFFEFLYMGATLVTASLMNEILARWKVSRQVRTCVLYVYIFWFGTIQGETWFDYPHILALALMFMVYQANLGRERSVLWVAAGVVFYRSLYNPFMIAAPIGKLCVHNMTRYMAHSGILVGYGKAVVNALLIFFSFTANQYFDRPASWHFLGIQVVLCGLFILSDLGYRTVGRRSFLARAIVWYTFLVCALVGFCEANYYRLPIDPLIWMGLACGIQNSDLNY